jgi:PleD family two-component response regulator
MIVAVLDDLMFTSKIRSAATTAGVTVVFARSRDAALTAAREQRPSLVILDLNNPRTDPLGIVAALKNLEHEVSSPPVATLGYVSHVDTATIDAARAAGIDTVLARSAFTQRVGEILRGR